LLLIIFSVYSVPYSCYGVQHENVISYNMSISLQDVAVKFQEWFYCAA